MKSKEMKRATVGYDRLLDREGQFSKANYWVSLHLTTLEIMSTFPSHFL